MTIKALQEYESLQNTPGYACIETEGEESSNKVYASVNGIFTSFESAERSANHLSKMLGGRKVHHFYNKSNGIKDIYEAAKQRVFGTETLEKSYNLAIFLMKLMDSRGIVENDGKLVLVAHSQGGLITKACEHYMPKKYRERIQVVAMGSPVNLDGQFNGNAKHFGASNDPVFRLSNTSSDSTTILKTENTNPVKAHKIKGDTLAKGILEFERQENNERALTNYASTFVYQLKKIHGAHPEMSTSQILEQMKANMQANIEQFKGSKSYQETKESSDLKYELKKQLHSLENQAKVLDRFSEIFKDTEIDKLVDPANEGKIKAKFLLEFEKPLNL